MENEILFHELAESKGLEPILTFQVEANDMVIANIWHMNQHSSLY